MFTFRLVIAASSLCAVSIAQPQEISARASAVRSVPHAAKRFGAVKIDGRLDDAAWLAATPVDDFVQQDPVQGRPATQRTEIRFLFDNDALYVGARMFDSLGTKDLAAALSQRNDLESWTGVAANRIAILFGAAHHAIDCARFELNPFGAKGDADSRDASNDPLWDGASSFDSLGWTAEFRIPYSELDLSSDVADAWGIQIWRTISQRQESDLWAFWKTTDRSGPNRFASLEAGRGTKKAPKVGAINKAPIKASFSVGF
jgi:hypothetical protein